MRHIGTTKLNECYCYIANEHEEKKIHTQNGIIASMKVVENPITAFLKKKKLFFLLFVISFILKIVGCCVCASHSDLFMMMNIFRLNSNQTEFSLEILLYSLSISISKIDR